MAESLPAPPPPQALSAIPMITANPPWFRFRIVVALRFCANKRSPQDGSKPCASFTYFNLIRDLRIDPRYGEETDARSCLVHPTLSYNQRATILASL